MVNDFKESALLAKKRKYLFIEYEYVIPDIKKNKHINHTHYKFVIDDYFQLV